MKAMPYTPPPGFEARVVSFSVETIDVTTGPLASPIDHFKKFKAGLVTARAELRRSGSSDGDEWITVEAAAATAERALAEMWDKAAAL